MWLDVLYSSKFYATSLARFYALIYGKGSPSLLPLCRARILFFCQDPLAAAVASPQKWDFLTTTKSRDHFWWLRKTQNGEKGRISRQRKGNLNFYSAFLAHKPLFPPPPPPLSPLTTSMYPTVLQYTVVYAKPCLRSCYAHLILLPLLFSTPLQ